MNVNNIQYSVQYLPVAFHLTQSENQAHCELKALQDLIPCYPSYFYFSLINRSSPLISLLLIAGSTAPAPALALHLFPFPAMSLESHVVQGCVVLRSLMKCHLLTEAQLGLPTEDCISSLNISYFSSA